MSDMGVSEAAAIGHEDPYEESLLPQAARASAVVAARAVSPGQRSHRFMSIRIVKLIVAGFAIREATAFAG